MKKEEIMTFIAMALIIIGEIISQNYTNKAMNQVTEQLIELKGIAIERNITDDKLNKKNEELNELWNEKSNILSYYIEHDELEKVSTQIRTIKADFEIENDDAVIPEIEKCIYIIEHIKEKYQLNFKNIF